VTDRQPDRIDHILEVVQLLDLRFTAFQARLEERCGDHQRQLNGQQEQLCSLTRRRPNGPNNAQASLSKIAIGLIAIIASLTTTLGGLIYHYITGAP
jgi:hypothetical protein